jgi:hypothetical protein
MKTLKVITINWKLGEEQGTQSCSNDREAIKFNESLLAKKLALVDLKPSNFTQFQNKVWSIKDKMRKAYRRAKREQLEREFAPLQDKLNKLKAIPLSVEIVKGY